MSERRRMFYNDDGDSCLLSYRGAMRPEMVTDSVDVLLGTPVTTLVLCVSYSDLVTYPSDVASMYGWRDTPSNRTSPFYRRVREFFRQVRERDWDIPKMVLQRAHEEGLEFIPSMRMNDAHFAQKVPPQEHPLTGQFWMEHQDLIINPDTSWPAAYREFMLDFRHAAVRQFRLDNAFEIIDRYAANGFEMDWTRHPWYFRNGEAQPELITDMVRQVRARLDGRGPKGGVRLPLIVRVSASIEDCLRIGLDVPSWVKEGLVDYVVPSSPSRYISFDMPISDWKALVAGAPVEVHASPDSAAPRGNGQATLEMYRAAASNYYAMGADGIYLFNLFCRGYPLADDAYVIMRDLSCPEALRRRDKLFMATLDNWRSDTDTLSVPLTGPDRPARIGLMVGDDLAAARAAGTLRRAVLRVRVDRFAPEDRLEIELNGTKLSMPGARARAADRQEIIEWSARTAAWTYERQTLKGPWAWIEIELEDVLPRQGDNLVTVRQLAQPAPDRQFELTLTDVDLAVSYSFCGSDPIMGAGSGAAG